MPDGEKALECRGVTVVRLQTAWAGRLCGLRAPLAPLTRGREAPAAVTFPMSAPALVNRSPSQRVLASHCANCVGSKPHGRADRLCTGGCLVRVATAHPGRQL